MRVDGEDGPQHHCRHSISDAGRDRRVGKIIFVDSTQVILTAIRFVPLRTFKYSYGSYKKRGSLDS